MLAALAMALAAMGGRASAAAGKDERWYAVMLQGERAGWMHEKQDATAEGNLRLRSEMRLSVGRGGMSISVEMLTESVETPKGAMVSMRSEQRLAAAPVVTTYRFTEEGVEVTEEQEGRSITRTAPLPKGEWLAPIAAERYVEERVRAGAAEVAYSSIDASGGLEPIAVKRTRKGGPEPVEVLGKVVPATPWAVTQAMYPGVESVDYLADDGSLVRGEVRLGAIALTVLAADRETATAPAKAPEMMVSTFVHPSRAIARPRETGRAVYIVSMTEGELPDLPSGGAQRVERLDARSARVIVDAARAPAAPEREASDRVFREPSVMLDSADPAVRALAPPDDDAGGKPAQAERIRRGVRRHITAKTLDVGFATASEVARTKQGDCTEHAVLLAAALRSAGIPSRVASGVIYVDQFAGGREVFGFHMWTQALLDGPDGRPRWVDLDATLPDATPFDAAHIAMVLSALPAEERMNSLAALAPMLGRLAIEVVETE